MYVFVLSLVLIVQLAKLIVITPSSFVTRYWQRWHWIFFFLISSTVFFFYVSEVDFRVKYSFNIDFRVKCVAS